MDRAIEGLVELRRVLDRSFAEEGGELPADFSEALLLTPPRLRDSSVTVREAAAILGIGEEQVRRLLRSGELLGVPYGGRAGWRLSRAYVEGEAHTRHPKRKKRPARTAETTDDSSRTLSTAGLHKVSST